ncbi:sulfatase [Pelagerythrobacter sp.]|uniref:sulfatase n=1 Tax=Pelagerythrobacter sp. TaxID=2800702 RepID=UPI0035AEE73A
MAEGVATPARRRDLRLTATVAALATVLVLSKAAIAWRDNSPLVPLDNVPLEALAGSLQGVAVLALLVVLGWLTPRRGGGMWLLGPLAAGYALLLLVNVAFAVKFGRSFSLFWLSYAHADNAVALERYLSAALTGKLMLALTAIAVTGVAAFLAARWLKLVWAPPMLLALLGAFAALAWGAGRLSPSPPANFVTQKVRSDPLMAQVGDAVARWRIHAAPDWTGEREWARRSFAARPLDGERPSLLLVVADSISAATFERMARAGEIPHLAAFAAEGQYIARAYTPVPTSAKAFLALHVSSYLDVDSFAANPAFIPAGHQTFSDTLRDAGYRTGLFMSGSLQNYGIADFLRNHPFDVQYDNANLACPDSHEWRRRLYDHPGDDCLIDAAARWIGQGDEPWFGWVWLNGTHYPYFAPDNPRNPSVGAPRERHDNALREVDRVFGVLLERLAAQGRLDDTLIMFVSDHGEAFGEHGDWIHGTSIYDEQVRVPLIVGPVPGNRGEEPMPIASLVDIGPTLLDAAGFPQQRAVQGRSLLRADSRRPVWFTSKGGGNAIGYRGGGRKVIFDYRDGMPLAYDLTRDPLELDPRELEGEDARRAMARIKAFIGDR